MSRKRLLAGVGVVVAVAAAGASWLMDHGREGPVEELCVSGMVEATTVDVGTEVSGTVAAILAHEGDVVGKGQMVAQLDTSTWKARLAQAEAQAAQAARRAEEARAMVTAQAVAAAAGVAEAEAARAAALANLAKLEKGSRPQEIAVAADRVRQAEAAWKAAVAAAEKARRGPRPQELDEARAALSAADAAVEAAQARLDRLRAGSRKQEIEQARAREYSVYSGFCFMLERVRPGESPWCFVKNPGVGLYRATKVYKLVCLTFCLGAYLPGATETLAAVSLENRILPDGGR
ncbi:MAG: biotin/lipoyl-binding protein, partial [Armatimonadetes bacterium]|nr:biotin/lipoyl-binding protein [Armatimonadota bacterium]